MLAVRLEWGSRGNRCLLQSKWPGLEGTLVLDRRPGLSLPRWKGRLWKSQRGTLKPQRDASVVPFLPWELVGGAIESEDIGH